MSDDKENEIVELSEFKYPNLIPYGLESGYFHFQFSLYILVAHYASQTRKSCMEQSWLVKLIFVEDLKNVIYL